MTHRTLIISAAQRDLCASLCATLAGPAGDGMYTTALYSGTEVTHYISAGEISDEFASILPLTTVDEEGNETTSPGSPETIAYLAGQADYVVTLEQVQAMLAEADVSQVDPHERMAQLGLSMNQPVATE